MIIALFLSLLIFSVTQHLPGYAAEKRLLLAYSPLTPGMQGPMRCEAERMVPAVKFEMNSVLPGFRFFVSILPLISPRHVGFS